MARTQRFRIEESDDNQVTLVRVREESEDSLSLSVNYSDNIGGGDPGRGWPRSFNDPSGSRIVICRRSSFVKGGSPEEQEQEQEQESYRYAGAPSYQRVLDYYNRGSESFNKRLTNSDKQDSGLMLQSLGTASSTGYSAVLDNVVKARNVAEDFCAASVKQEDDGDLCSSPSPSQGSSQGVQLGEEAESGWTNLIRQWRRREQNKYATQRYRLKKKEEVDNIFREEHCLVNKNRHLKHRVLCLVAEVARLKVCVRTVLQAKGVSAIAIQTLLGSYSSDEHVQ